MNIETKRMIVAHLRMAHDKFVYTMGLAGGDTSDFEERLDELELEILAHADIEFIRCSVCDEDELAEDIHHMPETDAPVCSWCWDERLRS